MVPDLSDILSRALGRLLWQFRNRATDTNIQRLVRVIVGQVEPLRDRIIALIEERTLDEAVGVHLDQWGTVIGLGRGGLGDDAYRIALQARLAVYLSNGTPEQLITIMRLLVGQLTVRLIEYYPATVLLQYYYRATPTTADERLTIVAQMDAAAAAGVAVEIVEVPTGYFGFAEDPDALGFDEGAFATLIV